MNAAKSNSDPNPPPPPETAEPEAASAVEQLTQQLRQMESERQDYLDKWMRAQAEFDNFRKRLQKDLDQERQYRAMGIVRDFLPGLDNLQRALQAAKSGGDLQQLVQGVQMVAQQLEDALGKSAVTPIVAAGQPFDPNLHEAVTQIPTNEHPPLTVLQEVERGYMLHDRVVRPSKVIVSSAPPAEG